MVGERLGTEKNWLELLSDKNQLQRVIEMNKKTEKIGLTLSEEDAKLLVEGRKASLREQQRVEFGEGILPKLIFTFCDSPYINQENYVDTMLELQEMFFYYKNESTDEMPDDELLDRMKEAFDRICQGSLEMLEDV